jgi:bacteriocin biosynthesis cyclodehydratase domain-containing protein
MRPVLLPHLRRLWRDSNTVQLGTDPQLATVLELDNPATVRVLDLLDGSRTERGVIAAAAKYDISTGEATAMIDALRARGLIFPDRALLTVGLTDQQRVRMAREAGALALAGLATRPGMPDRPDPASLADPAGRPDPAGRALSLAVPPSTGTPADMLRRRSAARVLVAGHAWLGALIAAALGAAGVGRIDPALDGWTRVDDAMLGGLLPADANRSRASAAADAVRRVAPEAVLTPLREGTATFLVRVGSRPGSALATRGVRLRTAPRLDVYLRDGVVVVGPLVLPGSAPCGQCLELHRRDRDTAWPQLAAQLATGRDTAEACAVTTALAGAAYAVEEVLRHTDGRPVRTVGATVEIAGPGTARRRSWLPHPTCDCSRRYRSSRSSRRRERPSNNGS